jgi:outer membrane receptor protein involved in Fe transport
MYQTDLSASWTARIDKLKLKPSIELFNLFNANYVLTETSVYPTQGRPLTILPGRLLRLSVSFDFQ